ncbi:phosphatase 1 [Escherichia coli DEC4E]|nr:phosphatase 1 [Escherichia coli DEC4E]
MLHEPDEKLETIGFDTKKDLLISVGDLVDRGTENVECLELITFPWFRAVRGNHEQMMIDGYQSVETSITGCLMAVAGSLISITTKKFWLKLLPIKQMNFR